MGTDLKLLHAFLVNVGRTVDGKAFNLSAAELKQLGSLHRIHDFRGRLIRIVCSNAGVGFEWLFLSFAMFSACLFHWFSFAVPVEVLNKTARLRNPPFRR